MQRRLHYLLRENVFGQILHHVLGLLLVCVYRVFTLLPCAHYGIGQLARPTLHVHAVDVFQKTRREAFQGHFQLNLLLLVVRYLVLVLLLPAALGVHLLLKLVLLGHQ